MSGPGKAKRHAQSGRQATLQRRRKTGNLLRRRRGGHHHLATPLNDRVERANQFLLRGRLGGQFADVLENGQTCPPVSGTKILDRLGLKSVGHFPGEIDRRGIGDTTLREVQLPSCRQSPGQMRLAGPAGTIEDQRVVRRGLTAKHARDGRLDEAVLRAGEELQGRRSPMAVLGRRIAGQRLTWQGNCHHAIGHFGSILRNCVQSQIIWRL